ncbi:hypothetical protein HT105_21860 [Bacteroides fragilis]|nr:hypothetical protein [Bacteroides fragilis]
MMESTPERFELDAAAAHRIVDSVAGIQASPSCDPGSFGEVALLYPGKRIGGIKRPSPRDDSHIEVHLVIDVAKRIPVATIADAARTARSRPARDCNALMSSWLML